MNISFIFKTVIVMGMKAILTPFVLFYVMGLYYYVMFALFLGVCILILHNLVKRCT